MNLLNIPPKSFLLKIFNNIDYHYGLSYWFEWKYITMINEMLYRNLPFYFAIENYFKKNIVLLSAKGSIFWPTRRSVSDVVISYYCLPFWLLCPVVRSALLTCNSCNTATYYWWDFCTAEFDEIAHHITCYSEMKRTDMSQEYQFHEVWIFHIQTTCNYLRVVLKLYGILTRPQQTCRNK